MDFTDLNKECLKDSFPLPKINQLVDATTGHELLSFMDAYSGYNHIPMQGLDEEIYCYKVMPFGLKNAGAIYQRLVNMMFADEWGKTIEVYVDDMLVMSKKASDHVAHLEKMFGIIKRFGMKSTRLSALLGLLNASSWVSL